LDHNVASDTESERHQDNEHLLEQLDKTKKWVN
jgi:topoisomerase-4 subunit B